MPALKKILLYYTNIIYKFSSLLKNFISDEAQALNSYVGYRTTTLFHKLTCYLRDHRAIHINKDVSLGIKIFTSLKQILKTTAYVSFNINCKER